MHLTRRSFLTSTALGVAASALGAPSLALAARQGTPSPATPIPTSADPESAMLATMEQLGIPGALVLVDAPETGLWTTALGVADLDNKIPMTTDTHMRIGSITKTFTATLVLQLVDRGLMRLDDPIDTLHPDLAALPNADAITIRHLLSMQSGLADYPALPAVIELSRDPHADVSFGDVVDFVEDEPALFAPGTQFMYSNTNYAILGMIAERLTDTSYPELIQASILDEIGLANTGIPASPDMPGPGARGYAWPQPGYPMETGSATPQATPTAASPMDVTEINVAVPGAAGSMVSTIGDLHAWAQVLRHGSLLSPEMHQAQLDTTNAPQTDGISYGLGIISADGMIGHTGGIDGFESIMLTSAEMDTTIVVLVNVLPPKEPVSSVMALLHHVGHH